MGRVQARLTLTHKGLWKNLEKFKKKIGKS